MGLFINDFALLNKITNNIKDKNIKLKHIKKLPVRDKKINILVSQKRIKNCTIPQIQPGNLDILELRIRCENYKCFNLTAGIDPGGMIGLSIIDTKRIMFINNYKKIVDLTKIVKSINEEIGLKSIKIGLGSPPERTRIIDALKEYSSIIQLVNEEKSGSGSHTIAATNIALRKGHKTLQENYKPKNGEIAWIQKKSRRLSKGLITINKEAAYNILTGEKTMEESLKKYTLNMESK